MLLVGRYAHVDRRVLPQSRFAFARFAVVPIGSDQQLMRRLCKGESVILEVTFSPIQIVQAARAQISEAF